jgi:hypothetical protein
MTSKDQNGISFHAYVGTDRELDLYEYGIGFYGSRGSGHVLDTDEWSGTAYLVEGDNPWIPVAQIPSVTYASAHSGTLEGELSILLRSIPNYQATINIRFDQPTPVKVVNVKCSLYDGDTLGHPPAGWNARLAEIIHTSQVQGNTGTGDITWHVASTGEVVSLVSNPGPSGTYANRFALSGQTRHDWYVALCVSPEQIGSKTAGLNVYLEYL